MVDVVEMGIDKEVKRLLKEDTREQKIIARSAKYRASVKKGFKGQVIMPTDLMSPQEKRKRTIELNKRCKIYNMYDSMISLEEFEELDDIDKKRHLVGYRRRFYVDQIIEEWGISKSKLYYIQRKLKIIKCKSFVSKPRKVKSKENL